MSTAPESVIEKAVAEEFTCHRCGACCKGDGVVEFGRAEAARMAEHLGLTREEFVRRYAIELPRGRYYLIDLKNEEKWCVFLERGADGLYGCKVNAAKPDQCAAFPYKWRNPDSFKTCEGLRAVMAGVRARAAGSSVPAAGD